MLNLSHLQILTNLSLYLHTIGLIIGRIRSINIKNITEIVLCFHSMAIAWIIIISPINLLSSYLSGYLLLSPPQSFLFHFTPVQQFSRCLIFHWPCTWFHRSLPHCIQCCAVTNIQRISNFLNWCFFRSVTQS